MVNTKQIEDWLACAAHCYQTRDYEKSYMFYDACVRHASNCAEGYGGRAYVLQDMGRLEEALKDYNKAIKLDPYYADGYMNRSTLYTVLQDYDKAIEDAVKAEELYTKQKKYSDAIRASQAISAYQAHSNLFKSLSIIS